MISSAQGKKERREAILRLLRAIPIPLRQERSAQLRRKLHPLLDVPGRLSVGLYAALPHEVDLLPLLREYPAHRYAFPRTLPGRQLAFHLVSQPEEELEPDAWDIPTPRPTLPLLPPEEMDILIVPGVAFTAAGERLGYGGGYYDRLLPLCTRANILSLAFPEQILPELPTEPHDVRIPRLITL